MAREKGGGRRREVQRAGSEGYRRVCKRGTNGQVELAPEPVRRRKDRWANGGTIGSVRRGCVKVLDIP